MEPIIISACTDAGVHIDGASLGAYNLGKYLETQNKEVIYIKNNPNFIKEKETTNLKKNLQAVNIFNQKLYNTILNNKEKFPIIIGGDHSLAIGSALASATINENIGLIWFDAHPDYNTFETTITGNIHGLPLAAINNFHNEDLTKFTNNYIKPENTVIVGARSIDTLEKENLIINGIKIFTTKDIKKLGINHVIKEAIKIATKNTSKIHISFDLDVIDPNIAPGVSVPEINGLSKEESLIALNLFLANISHICSFDLVEYNPLKDLNNKTYNIAIEILNTILRTLN